MSEFDKSNVASTTSPQSPEEFIVEFKGTSIPVVSIIPGCGSITSKGINCASVIQGIDRKFSQAPGYFDGELVIIDFSRLGVAEDGTIPISGDDLRHIYAALRQHGVFPVAVSAHDGVAKRIAANAKSLGMATLIASANHSKTALRDEVKTAKSPARAKAAPTEQLGAMVIESPVRSGQRIYAINRDLVVLGDVGAGAEVIADGSIHCYGALRGRALAGAAGDGASRIYAARFHAELVSIAGYYRIFEKNEQSIFGDSVRVSLNRSADIEREPSIVIEPLNKD